MYKSISVVFSVMMFLSILFTPAMAGQKTISLQGKLTDPTSNYAPITGVHDLYFRLYDAPAGGNALWAEQHLVNLPNNGVFNVVLGSSSTLDGISFNKQYYVGIVVDGGGVTTHEMAPRQPLNATPYSLGSTGDMNVGKDLYVVGTSTITSAVYISSSVYVAKNAYIAGNAVTTGTSTITGGAFISGRVGVGTANPQSKLHLIDASGDSILFGNGAGYGGRNGLSLCSGSVNLRMEEIANTCASLYTVGSHPLYLGANSAACITLGTDGKVGVGTMPVYPLDIAGPGVPIVNIRGAEGRLYVNNIGCNTGQTLSLLVKTYAPKMMINTTDETYALNVDGYGKCTGVWQDSDVRLKRNIRPLADDGIVNKVSRLQAIKYKYDKNTMMQRNKGAEDNDAYKEYMEKEAKEIGISVAELKQKREDEAYAYCDDEQIGLSAQELEKEFPELVKTDKSGYKAVNYDGLTVILIEALKKQQLAINDLEARVRNLESAKK